MKFVLNSLVITNILFCVTPKAVAGNDCDLQINCTIKNGDTTTTTSTKNFAGTNSQVQSSGGTTVTTTTAPTTSTPGVYDMANQAQNQSAATSMLGAATAASNMPQCGPHNAMACALAAAGTAVALLGMQAANNAQQSMDELGGDPTSNAATTADQAGVSTASLNQKKKDLAKQGYTVNDDGTIGLPNGQKLSSFDAASLRNAGFSGTDAFKIQNGVNAMQKGIADKTKELNLASASGGGGGAKKFAATAVPAKPQEKLVVREPASWAGFSKQYGDSNIGVSQADIFMLIEKRVEEERKAMGQ